MDSLQVTLALLGGVAIAALVGHNVWQSRKAGIRRAEPRPDTVAPPLDPMIEAAALARVGKPGPEGAASARPPEAPAAPAAPRRMGSRLHPLVDAIALLHVEAPVSGEQVLAHLPPTRRVGSKQHWFEGRNSASGQWELPHPGAVYRELRAGVQLANRVGPLNEIEYSEFVQKVQAFADVIGAGVDFPDMLDVVSRARELDAFASHHDAQLACRLYAATAAWSVGYIQQQAAACGFMPGAVPGRLVLLSGEEGAPPMLTLQYDAQAAFADDPNQAPVREMTLAFDVPQTPPAEQPFDAWQYCAQALARAMDAVLVDDAGQPLTPESFQSIGGELAGLYQQLEAHSLAAGSPAARRLFS